MIVIWDHESGNPPSLLFKPENQQDDACLKTMKSAWDTYKKHRKDFHDQ